MDKRVYLWLRGNLDKYTFTGTAANKLKTEISRLILTEESLESEMISGKMADFYEQFLNMFYNNPIGYQNGLENKSIVSDNLDCYFVDSADGKVPIGFFKSMYPAESVVIIISFLEESKNKIKTEKSFLVEKWQKNIDEISGKEAIINAKKPNALKLIFKIIVASFMFFMSVLGLLKLNVIESFFMSGNPDFYQLALKDIPVLANGGQGAWTGFLLFSIILFILGIVTCLFIYFDCKAFGSLAAVNRVLGNSLFYVKNIEQGISDSIDSGSEYMFRAARTGINTHLERNSNSALVLKAENEIRTAIDFINKRPVKLHIAVLLAFVLIAGISALVYSPGVAKVFEDIVTMAEVEEEEQPTQRPTHKPTQKPTPKPTPTPTPTQTPKPETYYIVRKSDITWESANNEAEYEGGYLVSINDAEEFSFIIPLNIFAASPAATTIVCSPTFAKMTPCINFIVIYFPFIAS